MFAVGAVATDRYLLMRNLSAAARPFDILVIIMSTMRMSMTAAAAVVVVPVAVFAAAAAVAAAAAAAAAVAGDEDDAPGGFPGDAGCDGPALRLNRSLRVEILALLTTTHCGRICVLLCLLHCSRRILSICVGADAGSASLCHCRCCCSRR